MKQTFTKPIFFKQTERTRLLLLLLLCTLASTTLAQEWTTVTPSNNGRIESQSVVRNGKMYVFAGFYTPWIPARSSEVYDPVLNRWTALSLAPRALTHQGIALVDETVWLTGGFTSANPKIPRKEVYIYNIATNTWSEGPALLSVRSSHAMVRLGRKLHVFGGLLADMDTSTGEHLVLDLDNQSKGWVPAAPLPFPRNHLSAAVVAGRIYAIGGQIGHDNGRTFLRYVHTYDPTTDTWTRKADLPTARSHFESSTAAHDGKIIVAGGVGPGGNLNRVTEYDPQTNVWTELPVLPQTLLAPNAKVINGQLIVSGGFNSNQALKTTRVRPVVGTAPDRLDFYPTSIALSMAPGASEASTAYLWTLNKETSYTIHTGSLPSWLSVTRVTGTADPAASAIGVTVNSAGLQPGRYSFTLKASATGYPDAALPIILDVTGTVPPNQPPNVSLSSPAPNSTHAAGTSITVSANASDADGSISKVEFFAGETKLGEASTSPFRYEWSQVQAGSYRLTARATDNDGANTTSSPVVITVTNPSEPGSTLVYRLNVGGGAVSDSGMDWSAHNASSPAYLSNGQSISSRAFTGTNGTGAPEAVFNTFRYDPGKAGDPLGSEMRWALPVAAGSYRVRLFFADTYAGTHAAGRRVFDMLLEGEKVLDGFDVFAAGGTSAVVREFTASVSDGQLNLDFLHRVENPLLSAIEISAVGGSGNEEERDCTASGTILREVWENVSGQTISTIPLQTTPTSTSQPNLFEGTRSAGDRYASRLRGYLCVPATGEYTFWISGDDQAELWLSTDESPANKARIAHLSGYTGYRQWTKYSTQKSAPISLVAGKRYYAEVLHKESAGGDHVSVGWQLPDGSLERPIQGNRLSPFEDVSATAEHNLTGLETEMAQAYPNPFQNTIRLLLAGDLDTDLAITVMDQLGRVAYREKVHVQGTDPDLEIDLSHTHLPAGFYFLQLQVSGVGRQTIKLLRKP